MCFIEPAAVSGSRHTPREPPSSSSRLEVPSAPQQEQPGHKSTAWASSGLQKGGWKGRRCLVPRSQRQEPRRRAPALLPCSFLQPPQFLPTLFPPPIPGSVLLDVQKGKRAQNPRRCRWHPRLGRQEEALGTARENTVKTALLARKLLFFFPLIFLLCFPAWRG